MLYKHSSKADLSFQSDYSEEEDDDLVTLHLGNDAVQINYSHLCKLSQLIRDKYVISDVKDRLPQEIRKFQQEIQISDENVIFFLKCIQEKNLIISNDKFRDLFKLAEFLQIKIFLRKLKKYSKDNIDQIDFIIQTILDEIESQKNNENFQYQLLSQFETILTNRINDCLQNDNFGKLPISLIYNIIKECDINQMSNDLLYDFINKSIDNLFVLFCFLDLKKLSNERLIELQKNYQNSTQKYYQHLPCNLDYMISLKEKNTNLQKELDQSKQEINILKRNQKLLFDENNQLKTNISNLKKENNLQSDTIKKMIRENLQIKNELDELKKQFNDLNRKYEISQTHLDCFLKSSENYSRGIGNLFNKDSNVKLAISLLEKSSDNGNCFASFFLGAIYSCGIRIEEDIPKSIIFYQKSADQGNPHGLNSLGYIYEKRDFPGCGIQKSIEYYTKAANCQNSSGFFNLGVKHKYGKGVKKNLSKAFEYFQKAAELNNAAAFSQLGSFYEEGLVIKKDYSKMIECYIKSSKLIDPNGLYNLGRCYENGIGTNIDISKAIECYQKAADLGNSSAAKSLKRLNDTINIINNKEEE